MDNPNVKLPRGRNNNAKTAGTGPSTTKSRTVNLRHHRSLPGPLRPLRPSSSRSSTKNRGAAWFQNSTTTTSRLIESKTNPYVGWFRHAPPLVVPHGNSGSNKRMLYWSELVPSTVFPKRRRSVATSNLKGNNSNNKNRNFIRAFSKLNAQERTQTLLYLHKILSLQQKVQQNGKEMDKVQKKAKDFYSISVTSFLLQEQRKANKLRPGFLPGGGKEEGGGEDEDERRQHDDLEKFFLEQCAESESVTVKALSRLACWFLDVPMIEEAEIHSFVPPPLEKVGLETSTAAEDTASLISDDEDDDASEYDNYDTATGSRRQADSRSRIEEEEEEEDGDEFGDPSASHLNSSAVLSSQAEAYYALHVVHNRLMLESSEDEDDKDEQAPSFPRGRRGRSHSVPEDSSSSSSSNSSRLDYDISQMDILRMNRIASRHLDVESIVRLPTVTFGDQRQQAGNNNTEKSTKTTSDPASNDPMQQENSCEQTESVKAIASKCNEPPRSSSTTEDSWMLVQPDEMRDADESVQRADYSSSKANDDEQEQRDVCVICLEHFVPGDRLRVLPCKHSFHVGCIDRWLSGSHSFDNCYTSGCPTCKHRPDLYHNSHYQAQPQQYLRLHESDGSVPSWAFAQIGDALARESRHF